MKKIEDFKALFNKKTSENGTWFRLGKTFRTKNKFLFLDTGTGKVIEVNENVYRVLDCLFKTNNFDKIMEINLPEEKIVEALNEISESINNMHILSAPLLSYDNVGKSHINNYEKALQNNMHSITLELSEQCNLRCKYCIYNKDYSSYREFSPHNMSYDTAKAAVDFLMKNSPLKEKVSVGFYGGEPLLQFPLIKKVVEYINEKYSERNVFYTMTSNMTLMTSEKASFLSSIKNFSIVASIDGPKEIHNENRLFENGKGSFDAAYNGLITYASIHKKSINSDKPIMCSLVLSEPYTEEKFEKINSFFADINKKYKVGVLISYVSYDPKSTKYIPIEERPENDWKDENYYVYDPLMIWNYQNIDSRNFTDDYFTQEMLNIHIRSISDQPMCNYSLNGCCIPGSRRLYVTAKGDFLPCERVGSSFSIGNVVDGFDLEKIRKNYIDDFIEQEIKYCGECWAINLCSNCYISCFGENDVDFSYRHSTCKSTRKRISESLSLYHELMSSHPDIIMKLNDIEIE